MNKHVLVFNKASKAYFAVVSVNAVDQIDENFFTTKIVEFNDNTHEWDGGDLDNGQVITKGSGIAAITESELDQRCAQSIADVYQTHHELNTVIDVLSEIIETQGMSSDAIDRFNEVKNFIATRRKLNERYKQAYQSDPNWSYISKEEAQAEIDRLYDGGVYEKIINSQGV
jgi:hypothetical protein